MPITTLASRPHGGETLQHPLVAGTLHASELQCRMKLPAGWKWIWRRICGGRETRPRAGVAPVSCREPEDFGARPTSSPTRLRHKLKPPLRLSTAHPRHATGNRTRCHPWASCHQTPVPRFPSPVRASHPRRWSHGSLCGVDNVLNEQLTCGFAPTVVVV